MKRILLAVAIALASFFAAATAYASPFDVNFSVQDSGDSTTPYAMNIPGSQYGYGDFYLLGVGTNGSDYLPHAVNIGSNIQFNGTSLVVQNVPENQIAGLSADLASLYSDKASTTDMVALSGTVSTLNSQVGSILPLATSVQRAVVTTSGSGTYTWTYPNSYGTSTPVVIGVAEDSSSGSTNVQILSKSATSTTIQTSRITSALGILSIAMNPSVKVDIMAMMP